MADYDDIQLDAETLRKIEEEARREAEAEFAADETIMQEIESQVLQEMGVEDVELDDDFMADLKQELSDLYDGDIELDDLDLDEFDIDLSDVDLTDIQEAAPEPASVEAPVVNTDTGTVKRAKAEVRKKVRKRMARAAAEQIRDHEKGAPRAASIEMLEAEIQSKSGTLKVALILVIVIVTLGIAGAVAIFVARTSDDAADPASITVIQDRTTGKTLTPQELEAKTTRAAAAKLFKVVLQAGDRRHQSVEDFKQALANIETLRADFPDFAKEQEEKLAERETFIKEKLAIYGIK